MYVTVGGPEGVATLDEGGVAKRPRPQNTREGLSARVHRLVGDLTLTHVDELADDA